MIGESLPVVFERRLLQRELHALKVTAPLYVYAILERSIVSSDNESKVPGYHLKQWPRQIFTALTNR